MDAACCSSAFLPSIACQAAQSGQLQAAKGRKGLGAGSA